MRAFLISYSWSKGHMSGSGYMTIQSTRFPSRSWIYKKIEESDFSGSPVIMNIFEFKSMEDFNDFMSGEDVTGK